MKFLRGLALSIAFTLLTPSSYAQAPNQFNSDGALAFNPNGTPLAGFNADGSANTNLPPPVAPPGIVPPQPHQFNSDGALAFNSDGAPLAGFNADGKPIQFLPAPVELPGSLAPLPPPLFNSDGTPFVVGSKLEMPVRADGTKVSYEFDSISGWYLPVTRVVNEPIVPPQPNQFNKDGVLAFNPDGAPLAGFNADGKPIQFDRAPGAPVLVNPDGTLINPNSPGPLPPPLFNPDGTKFIVGSKIQTPVRVDGTQISYDYDSATGLYWPTSTETSSSAIAAPGVVSISFVYDQLTKQMVPVTYRSAQLPAVNPDGSINDASKVVVPVIKENTPATYTPKEAQIGSWAVVDKKGNVINAILCSEKVCGADGDWGGKFIDPVTCPNGCPLVLQIPANPITGQSMGGYLTGGNNKVTYKNGEFKVESAIAIPVNKSGKAGATKTVTRTIKDGVITDITGEKIDLSTGFQLPSVIKDSGLRKQVDVALTQAQIQPVKSSSGYRLATDDQLPAIDSTLKVIAVKSGSKSRSLKLSVDKTGELFLPTKLDLTGYEIQIKRGGKVLKEISLD